MMFAKIWGGHSVFLLNSDPSHSFNNVPIIINLQFLRPRTITVI